MGEIVIKPLRTMEEMTPVVELQRVQWGDSIEAAIPAHMLFSLANHGGHVFAALDEDRVVGALIGFLGTNMEDTRRPAMANLQIVSKRMVVLPEYRNQGVGYRLKMAQRDFAIQQGVRLVVWTFDPLVSLNAHLNIRKLGGVSTRYLLNYYGTSEQAGLVTLGSSDRLEVDWWVTNRRVEERILGKRGDLKLAQYLEANTNILNPTQMSADGLLLPAEKTSVPAGSLALLEIPTRFPDMVKNTPELAKAWRNHTRVLFLDLFRSGFIVTDFLHEAHEGRDRAFYLLSYNGPQFESFLMN